MHHLTEFHNCSDLTIYSHSAGNSLKLSWVIIVSDFGTISDLLMIYRAVLFSGNIRYSDWMQV